MERASRRALALTEKSALRDDAERAHALGNLGVAIEGTRPADAARLHRQSVIIWRRLDGTRDERTLHARINEGGAWREHAHQSSDLTSADDAIAAHRRALNAARALSDRDLTDLAENNLGLDLRVKARVLTRKKTITVDDRRQIDRCWRESELRLRAVLQRRRARFGNDHVLVVQSLKNVGAVVRDQERYAESLAYFDEALSLLDPSASLARAQVLDHRILAHVGKLDFVAARRDAEAGMRLVGDDQSPVLLPLRRRFKQALERGDT